MPVNSPVKKADSAPSLLLPLEQLQQQNSSQYMNRDGSPGFDNDLDNRTKPVIRSNPLHKKHQSISQPNVFLNDNVVREPSLSPIPSGRSSTIDNESPPSNTTANMMYGFVPLHLIRRLQDDNDWQARASAVEDLNALIHGTAHESMQAYLKEFLVFLCSLLNDKNFKICLTSYQMLLTVIERAGTTVKPVLSAIMPYLCEVSDHFI